MKTFGLVLLALALALGIAGATGAPLPLKWWPGGTHHLDRPLTRGEVEAWWRWIATLEPEDACTARHAWHGARTPREARALLHHVEGLAAQGR